MTTPEPALLTLTPAAIAALADIYTWLLQRRAAKQTQERKP